MRLEDINFKGTNDCEYAEKIENKTILGTQVRPLCEENKRRDLDNVCFAKKFILDSMVKTGKLKDDNRNFVKGFRDDFEYGKSSKVILEIEEIK